MGCGLGTAGLFDLYGLLQALNSVIVKPVVSSSPFPLFPRRLFQGYPRRVPRHCAGGRYYGREDDAAGSLYVHDAPLSEVALKRALCLLLDLRPAASEIGASSR
jgi:hypothetical protein